MQRHALQLLLHQGLWLCIAFSPTEAVNPAIGLYTNTTLLTNKLQPNIEDLILPKGYPMERHEVKTSDGYILTLFRIPHGKYQPADQTSRFKQQSSPNIVTKTDSQGAHWHPFNSDSDGQVYGDHTANGLSTQRDEQPHARQPPKGAKGSLKIQSTLQVEGPEQPVPGASSAPRGPILLQHGLLDCSATWVNNDAEKSLAFLLADQGFDVWLGNVRGSTFSRSHTEWDEDSAQFWDFGFDEMATRDIPAMLKHVVLHSGHSKLSYIGHSQGCTVLLAALAAQPYLEDMIHRAVLLAPAVFATNIQSFPLRTLAKLDVADVFKFFGVKEFLPSTHNELFGVFCSTTPQTCSSVLAMICGYNPDNINPDKLQEYVRYSPAGTSVRNMVHWTQRVNAKTPNSFAMYDFGDKCYSWLVIPQDCNWHRYGRDIPPEYSLSNISLKLAVYSGGQDVLATPQDIVLLLRELPPGVVVQHRQLPSYAHLDFLWGETAHAELYSEVVGFLKQRQKPRLPLYAQKSAVAVV